MAEEGVWRRCSSCKGDILLGDSYFTCSVSTCNSARAPLVFCSLECWQSHVPAMRHRDAWAEEHRAVADSNDAQGVPAKRVVPASSTAEAPPTDAKRRRIVSGGDPSGPAPQAAREGPREVLIVASKLKSYIRAWGEMNTSDRVLSVLSDHVRELSRRAVRVAAQDGRKTVLDRDFATVLQKLEER
jgi:hypothetical protein